MNITKNPHSNNLDENSCKTKQNNIWEAGGDTTQQKSNLHVQDLLTCLIFDEINRIVRMKY
jgi:hypothetical protein